MKHSVLTIVLIFTTGLVLAQVSGLYIQLGRWEPDVSGDVTTDLNDAIDIASDLALDSDSPTLFSARLFGQKHVLAYTSWDLSINKSGILTNDLSFGDSFYPLGTEVDSSLEAQYQELQYRYLFVRSALLKVGGVLAYQKVDTSIGIMDESVSRDAGMPAVGLAVTATTPRTKAYGDALILYGRGDNGSGTLLRAEGGVDLFSGVGLFLGAQLYDLNMDIDAYSFDWSFSGIFAGVYLHL
ncbi:MAG TPA: hypothetical protein PK014_05005 [Thermoanaerobaculia bacterium]|nr:hypothetical protein [Thermoanaerobaculia bacterium]HUM29491.1 hypothetical protein [Thermoanaerobaculia bacterium]HXK67874.1 hypothetical protein [Thermoanaerobaculia bacterium]